MQLRGWLRWCAAAFAGVAMTDPIAAQSDPAANSLTLDLYAFSQGDDGGNPLREESFDYYAFRGGLKLKADDEYTLRLIANPAYLDNSGPAQLPASIINGSTTSASGDLATLDVLAKVDVSPASTDWTYSPGIYYHHEIDYIGTGVDMDVARRFHGGDATVKVSYSFRMDFLELSYWDQTHRGSDERMSNNVQVSWTQNLSPSWKGLVGVQYSRQDGFLSDQHNYVALSGGNGVPFLLVDEVLPGERNRVQLNGRLRYSPWVGHSVGLDSSYYTDDWDIQNFAIEPSVDVGVGGDVRLRAWWRVTVQEETKYFREMPTGLFDLRTQDSDLGSFTMHSPGVTLRFPLGGEADGAAWEGATTVYGFDRDDGIRGIGGKFQVLLKW